MKLRTILFTIIIMSFVACKTVKVPVVNAVNISEAQVGNNYKFVYTLPRTAINVRVRVHKQTYRKGPYQKYAKSYLNLNKVIDKDKEVWTISDVEFSSYPIPDTSKVYIVATADKEDIVPVALSKNGFLKSIFPTDNKNRKSFKQHKFHRQDYKKQISTTKQDYSYTTNHKKLSFDQVPLPQTVLNKATVREQAAELSKKILSIREDRAAILVGDGYTENMPDGKALEVMIKKIDLVQSQYLSMFKGKTTSEYFEYNFTYIPENESKFSKAILFRFSKDKGIVGNADMSGVPIILEIKAYNTLSKYQKFKYSNMFAVKAYKNSGLHYNVGETAKLRLLQEDKTLAEYQVVICQMGTVDKLPSEYLNGIYTIDFYPDLGTLKSIRKID